jgi:hypothetical protein
MARYAVALGALTVHALLAPLLSPLIARRVQLLAEAMDRSLACLYAVSDLDRKTLIVLGGPTDFWISYLQAELAWKRRPRPREVVWLTSAGAPVDVSVADGSLSFDRRDASAGFFEGPAEALYRSPKAALARGQTFELPALVARIDELSPQGAPSRITFELREPLDSGRHVLLVWQGERYELGSPETLARLGSLPEAFVLEALLSAHAPSPRAAPPSPQPQAP